MKNSTKKSSRRPPLAFVDIVCTYSEFDISSSSTFQTGWDGEKYWESVEYFISRIYSHQTGKNAVKHTERSQCAMDSHTGSRQAISPNCPYMPLRTCLTKTHMVWIGLYMAVKAFFSPSCRQYHFPLKMAVGELHI